VKVTIHLPAALYRDLCELTAATGEEGYTPAHYATELVTSELAARRLPRVAHGRNGGRPPKDAEPVPYRVVEACAENV
jgi:hypothetical protein